MTNYNSSDSIKMTNYNSSDFIRVNSQDPCKACGSDHGCSYVLNNGWRKDLCLRNRDTARFASDGRAIHNSRDDRAGNRILTPLRPLPAPIKRRHAVYTKMLELLSLEGRERDALLARGLNKKQVKILEESGHKSTKEVSRELSSGGFILDRVAGFYREDDHWVSNVRDGLFCPARDSKGRIAGLQIRRAEGKPKYIWFSSWAKILPGGERELLDSGASSGAPVNWVAGEGRTAWVTEGTLKASICGLLTGLPFLGKAGTGAGTKEIADASLNFDEVILAYDNDWRENENVRVALINQYETIKERSGADVRVAIWDDHYKGLDDFLLGAEQTKIVVSDFQIVKEIHEKQKRDL